MASTYNGSVANLVDPLTSSPLNSPSHAGQHTEINDALQTLGIWQTYTPTFSGFTLGNGTINVARYTQFNKTVMMHVYVTLGSTSVMTGPLDVSVPINYSGTHYPILSEMGGLTNFYDASPGALYLGRSISLAGNRVRVNRQIQSGATEIGLADMTSTAPFTWASGDWFAIALTYEAA